MKMKALVLLATVFGVSHAMAATFTLESDEFKNGGILPLEAGGGKQCGGQNLSPSLNISGVPRETHSLVLLIDDPQGNKGLGVNHFVGYGIEAKHTRFNKGDLSQGKGYIAGTNAKGVGSYSGPCPPEEADIHNYNFTLIATDYAPSALPQGLTRGELIEKLKGHAINSAGLVGQYIQKE